MMEDPTTFNRLLSQTIEEFTSKDGQPVAGLA